MRNVLVRVFGSDGRARAGLCVKCWVYQFGASGFTRDAYTNSSGEAEFDLDVDSGAEISLHIDGTEVSPRGAIRGSYRVEYGK